MLQEPLGLGLLEPSPGLGLQGLASFPRHLLSPSSVFWAGGSPQGLGRCLVRGGIQGGKAAVISGPSDAKPVATFSSLSPDPPGWDEETHSPPSQLPILSIIAPKVPPKV